MFEVALSLSIAGLLIGPVLTSWARGRASALATLDAAMLGVVLPLLLLRLVPHLIDEIGPIAVAAVAAGYAVFMAVESRTHAHATRLGVAILLPTLAIHSFLDGTALAVAFEHGVATAAGWTLGAALVLHRIPEGLVLASALIPAIGLRGTMLRISLLAALTVVGALVGRELLAHTPDRALHLVVAVGIGVMLRMILHQHRDPGSAAGPSWRDGVAFLVTAAVSTAVPGPWQLLEQSQPHELSAVQALGPLFIDTAPWILASLVLGELTGRAGPRSNAVCSDWPAAWLAVAILAMVWFGAAFAAATAIPGLMIVTWFGAAVAPKSWAATLHAIVPRAAAVIPSYATGIAIATTIEATVPADAFAGFGYAALPLAVIAGALLHVGVVGAVPMAAILVHKGAFPGAGLAFLLVQIIRCSALWRAPRTRQITLAVAAGGVAWGASPVLSAEPALHRLVSQFDPTVAYACAGLLGTWMLVEFVRSGPRSFFDEIR